MEGEIPQNPLSVGDLHEMGNKGPHPIRSRDSAWTQSAVHILNVPGVGGYCPVEKPCPPDEVLAGHRS
jgi:hypothetical protein